MPIDFDEITKRLNARDKTLFRSLETLFASGATTDELLDFIVSNELDEFVAKGGLNKILQQHDNEFDIRFKESFNRIKSGLSQETLTRVVENAELIKASNNMTVLGYFQYQTERLRTHLASGLIGGKSFKDTVIEFGGGIVGQPNPIATWHHFTDANVGTVIHTSYIDYGRTITADAFIDSPEQKFEYVGGLIPTSSEQCTFLMNNQKEGGYTMAEIRGGIQTPDGTINWSGRVPNWNCIHEFLPVD